MKLYAIGDLHLDHEENRRGLEQLPVYPGDWLALVGDVSHKAAHLCFALDVLGKRFTQLIWVPGNHDLWSEPAPGMRGESKYRHLVALCGERGVLTPEDDFVTWPGSDGDHPYLIVPLFLLYDYSYRPAGLSAQQAVAWAAESGVVCADEIYLPAAPHASRSAWCAARCAQTASRIAAAVSAAGSRTLRTVLISHWPLRQQTARTPRIPRFSIWCGTHLSDDWHRRFSAEAVVYGHLHIRRSEVIDGVRFEEVSLGYPGQWDPGRGIASYLRRIL